MKNLFKYFGIFTILLFGFYYTEKMNDIVIKNSSLVKEINAVSADYNILPVSAIIEDEYIIPGLNGYAVNVLKSYNNMRFLDTFNSYYLEYDKVKPDISLENNKDKIIKQGNSNKNSVSLVLKDNLEVIKYSEEKNIKISRLIDHYTFDKNIEYEQINNDYEEYYKVETMLNNNNINKNLCYINDNILSLCKKNKKYLIEPTYVLNNYNLANVKEKIKKGNIIYINDNVNLVDYKLLLKQIYYQNFNVVYLSELISEEH